MKRNLPHVIFYIMSVVCLALLICGGILLTEGRANLHKHVGGHIYATQPTCTAAGNVEYWQCETCGKYFADELFTEEISQTVTVLAKLTHTEETIHGTPATCTAAGMTDKVYCKVCNTVFEEQTEIKALGHDLGFNKAKQSTCFEHGNPDYWHCKRCEQNFAEEECQTTLKKNEISYPLADHTYKLCFNNNRHYKIATCGHELEKDGGAHNFVNRTCTDCGFHNYDVTYSLNADGTAYSVTDRPSFTYQNDVEIYGEYDGLPVTEIAFNAFASDSVESLVLPDSITNIRSSSFYNCKNLTEIRIPKNAVVESGSFEGCIRLSAITVDDDNPYYTVKGNCLIDTATGELVLGCKTSVIPNDGSVLSIGRDAFSRQENLTEISIPDSVTEINSFAFSNCKNLAKVTFPDKLTAIRQAAFCNCENLTELSLPDSVESIYGDAFYGCSKLTRLHIPAKLTYFNGNPFQRCTNLEEITVDENNRRYRSEGNCLISIDWNSVILGCKTSVIPDGVDGIGRHAFSYCPITQITIPDSVTRILAYAFEGCSKLTSLHIPKNVREIGNRAFTNLSAATEITVDPANTFYYAAGNCLIERSTKTLLVGCKNSVIPSDGSVTQIADGAFNSTDIESAVIPAGVTEIKIYTFSVCQRLTEVILPATVRKIRDYSFSNCTALADIYYDGTKEQWLAIEKDSFWNQGAGEYTVHFNDGTTMKKGEE